MSIATCTVDSGATQQRREFRHDVIFGLSRSPKRIPSKYFYDARGSQLFDRICELPEYYPTRCELEIMRHHADDMARQIDRRALLVEYGSGSSTKTRLLLDHLLEPAGYVPVDVSREHLLASSDQLAEAYPHIEILPVCADFTEVFPLPIPESPPSHAAVYFPGSTIGNFTLPEIRRLLWQIRNLCGRGGGLLLGIDLVKDPDVIHAAYNDRAGVTAQFNQNLLHRANAELGADFDVDAFEHLAVYNHHLHRIEAYLVSQRDQTASIGARQFSFSKGERIGTEYSHKFTVRGFARLAGEVGFALRKHWTDQRGYFAVLHLVADR